ncbi:MAG TPA: tRNA lysidine(34) synthetase TilS, partial [Ferruginibacter sp.]|nr:tRNA lysidine(34) synthetase TilS [Ferruginibacter sp.]
MDLLEKFKSYIDQRSLFRKSDRLLIAVSGGVDSVVLCELCKLAGYDFIIAHCNFRLRGEESDRDEKFAQWLSEKYGVEYFARSFDTTSIAKAEKKSIEETARDLRYNWFHELLADHASSNANYILTAHHADDNVETVMMNFFRGTGIKGLRGILPKQGKLIRPLLFASKQEIEDFAKQHDLQFVTDHTNAENEFTRNYFRNEIIPMIEKKYPAAKENILKNIERVTDAGTLYDQAIDQHKKQLLEKKGSEIHIPVLKLMK